MITLGKRSIIALSNSGLCPVCIYSQLKEYIKTMGKYEDQRVNYSEKDNFDLEALPSNPLELFKSWYEDIIDLNLKDSNAMVLSTNSPEGFPNSRFVLMKELTSNGFIFYTNYTSQKGADLSYSDKVSLTFWWKEVEKQVRIKGVASKINKEKSREYFLSRPRSSQIAALASSQSESLESRGLFEARFKEIEDKFSGKEIPYPDFWGGYLVEPISMEFWQGRSNRMHDRMIYKKHFSMWIKELLWP